tara:strand:- start:3 stop:674 length:672 start_codon:yes stop_codon:yes gene_type:complete
MSNNFSIFITNTSRSLIYLKYLSKNKLKPKNIIYLNNKNKKFSKILRKEKFFFPKVKVINIFGTTINSKKFNFLKNIKSDFIVFSGYSSDIVKKDILSLKKLIHCHPGKLPKYKGSTTIYYSILNENKIFCSSIVLNQNIDEGNILLTKEFSIPKNIYSIDKSYDDEIRAKTLVETLKKINYLKSKKQKKNKYSHYYVIHPILRIITFNKKFFSVHKLSQLSY